MPDPEIKIFPDLESLSRAVAERFAALARAAAGAGKPFIVALSGGSTPRRTCELLADPALAVPWSAVHLFQVDERFVPPDHEESNFRMLRQALLDRAPVPAENVHRIRTETGTPLEAAREYEKELRQILAPSAGAPPRFDLILLGLGADGHTASLFPGSPALEERARWVAADFVQKLLAWRVTLTLPVLNAAREIIFLVSGAEKADTLRRVVRGREQRLPAERVRLPDGRLAWFADADAARLLAPPKGSA
jgi:6-phosphogluconolactonase